MNKRQSRAEMAERLAPIAPPCFSSRSQWVEYVSSCAVEQREGHAPGPLLFEQGEPASFNPKFSLCMDCDNRHAKDMQRIGKCRPRYLIELFAAKAVIKEPA